ncbi:hypothetical protein JCM19379_12100 [Methyloparacoccus murrellii]
MDILKELEAAGTIETLTIIEAALLAPDFDLDDPELFWFPEDLKLPFHKRPRIAHYGIIGKINAIYCALHRREIKGFYSPGDENRSHYYDSSVYVDSFLRWLDGLAIKPPPGRNDSTEALGFMDCNNPRYAPKLAAAVSAWQAVTDPVGKHPKQALVKWLRGHAAEFEMTDGEGKPNETGIEEVAKVANWQLTGGAAKTPGK